MDDKSPAENVECRRTRSGKVVTTPSTKSLTTKAKKGRKKVILMEVEVSEDEDDSPSDIRTSDDNCDMSVGNDQVQMLEKMCEMEVPTNPNSLEHSVKSTHSSSDEPMREVNNSMLNEEPNQSDKSALESTISMDALNNHSKDDNLMVDSNEKDVSDEVLKANIDCYSENNTARLNSDMLDSNLSTSGDPSPLSVPLANCETLSNNKVSPTLHVAMETEGDKPIDKPSTVPVADSDSSDTKSSQLQSEKSETKPNNFTGEPDAESISEDELPQLQIAKVPETEEVSDEELPAPKRAELPADTEVVSEDELPTIKKDNKRKLVEGDYDPGSPTSGDENSTPAKRKATTEAGLGSGGKDTSGTGVANAALELEKASKVKKLPELDKYWKAVNDDPTDFTGWTYLLQYVDQENDMEAAREAYDAFLSHYPYCYGYWRKYADYEKRRGNKKKCEEVFERGLKAIPLSVDLWIHYLTYVKTSKPDDEQFIRSQFERALTASGLEFRSDRLWDSYIKWETEGKRLQNVTAIYDRLFTTPTQGYTAHFENFQEHVNSNPPNKVVEVDEFLALRKEAKNVLKGDTTNSAVPNTETKADSDAPPGEDEKIISTDDETKAIRERIISIRRKIHKATVQAVLARWGFEEGIKRPYFHVKPLERCQLKNWQEYLDYEIAQQDRIRIVVLFERCLIACALYEEFWLKFVHYLEGLNDRELEPKIRDVYERACTIHHLKKPNLHLQWAIFEEQMGNINRAAEILVNLEKSVPNVMLVACRRINLERRRGDLEKAEQLYEHYISSSKNKSVSTNLSIKYARFCLRLLRNAEKAASILNNALTKDPTNPRIYMQLIDLKLQENLLQQQPSIIPTDNNDEKISAEDDSVTQVIESPLEAADSKPKSEERVILDLINAFLDKDNVDPDHKVLFAQRKLEYLEDFGFDIQSIEKAQEEYQKHLKYSKEVSSKGKKDAKNTDIGNSTSKKDRTSTTAVGAGNPTSVNSAVVGQQPPYGNYAGYASTNASGNGVGGPTYQYPSGAQGPAQYNYGQYGQTGAAAGSEQYQYQGWQYPQGATATGYGGYNQWGQYGGGYGY